MIMSSGFVMFVLFGLVIFIGKALEGEKGHGCLIGFIFLVLVISCLGWFVSLITMI